MSPSLPPSHVSKGDKSVSSFELLSSMEFLPPSFSSPPVISLLMTPADAVDFPRWEQIATCAAVRADKARWRVSKQKVAHSLELTRVFACGSPESTMRREEEANERANTLCFVLEMCFLMRHREEVRCESLTGT